MRARVYRPGAGRWVSREPFGEEEENCYTYVGNNPVVWVDPEGKQLYQPPGWGAFQRRLQAEWRGLFGPLGWLFAPAPRSKFDQCTQECGRKEVLGIAVGMGVEQAVKHFISRAAAKYVGLAGWIYTAARFANCMDKCMHPDRRPCPKPKALGREPTLPLPGYGYIEDSYGRRLYY